MERGRSKPVRHFGDRQTSAGSPGRAPLERHGVQEEPTSHRSILLQSPVLVLNASYEPINICAARRAIVLVLKGLAMAEEENGHALHAARFTMCIPSVIRLLEYRRIPHQTRA